MVILIFWEPGQKFLRGFENSIFAPGQNFLSGFESSIFALACRRQIFLTMVKRASLILEILKRAFSSLYYFLEG